MQSGRPLLRSLSTTGSNSAPASFPPLIDHAVILAGGKGTRLASLGEALPKPLFPVAGIPVLEHQLNLLAAEGFREVRIFAGHLAEKIETFLESYHRPGLEILLDIEHIPLGSAGAVIEKLDSLPKHFAVLYGDTMLDVDLVKMAGHHLRTGADLTALVHPNDHPFDSDLVEIADDGRITALHPYPHPEGACFRNLVSAALYVVRREALRPWAGETVKRDFAKDVFPALLERGALLHAYQSHEYIKDMGTPARLEKVERDWNAGRIRRDQGKAEKPVIFLDRDGTLNHDSGHLRSPSNLRLLPSVAPALRLLRASGYRLIVLTNQPVIARGEATESDLAAIHRKLEWELGLEGAYLDAIYHCPHHPDRGFPGERPELKIACSCRKPGLGMLERARAEFPVDLSRSWVIGDSTTDLELARGVGLRSILVETGAGGRDGKYPEATPTHTAFDLLAAANWLVARTTSDERPTP